MASPQTEKYVNSEPPICNDCGCVFDVLMGVKDYDRIPVLIAHITQCKLRVSQSLEEAIEKANRLTAELEKLRQRIAPTSTKDKGTTVVTHLDNDEKVGRKRKNVTNEDERRLLLENDPWTKAVAKTQITCKACLQIIQLDGRNGCAYYRYNWIKHKAGCRKIPLEEREAVKAARTERGQANKGRHPRKLSKAKVIEISPTTQAGAGSMKPAEAPLMAAPIRPSSHLSDRAPASDTTSLRGSNSAEGSRRKKIKLENFDQPREVLAGTDHRLHSPYATQSVPDNSSGSIPSKSGRSRFFDTVLCRTEGIDNAQVTCVESRISSGSEVDRMV